MESRPQFSIVVPVYRNAASLPMLVDELQGLAELLPKPLEVVFVDDGSPDESAEILAKLFQARKFAFQGRLIRLSRNFGAFTAIRAGLAHASGECMAMMSADLQDPPEAIHQLFQAIMDGGKDVAFATRLDRRNDPWLTRVTSLLFWSAYRRFIQPEMPAGGFDLFACSAKVRDTLLSLRESHSSLVGMLLWTGFRRAEVSYRRRQRLHGKSSWSFKRRVGYLFDSAFSFSSLPITCLLAAGAVGIALSAIYLLIVLAMTLAGRIPEPGFPTLAGLITIFGAANLFALGIVGEYAWRTYENSKGRPAYVVMKATQLGVDRDEFEVS